MLSATNGVAGSGKKPRKSRGKGLRTNTGWYVKKYATYLPMYRSSASEPWRLYRWARVYDLPAMAQDGDILIRSQYHLSQTTYQM